MKKENNLIIFTDGGARGNPGPAAVGVIIKNSQGERITGFGQTIGQATNNVAEYQAVISALICLLGKPEILTGIKNIEFFLDSTLVVNQLNGKYKIKDPKLKNLIIKIKDLEKKFSQTFFYHFIPRTKNYQADVLVNQALDKQSYQ
jgi:ribonuclease HI